MTHWHLFTVYISGITVHFTGGPGSGKLTQCQNVIKHYKKYKWVHLSIGDLLRQNMLETGSANKKWSVVTDLVKQG